MDTVPDINAYTLMNGRGLLMLSVEGHFGVYFQIFVGCLFK